MKNIFLDHPRSINETYWQHLLFALKCGSLLVTAGILNIIHAIFPFIFQSSASTMTFRLAEAFAERRRKCEEIKKNCVVD